MSLITALDINASGLTAQRARVEVTSANLANSQTTRTPEGGPYIRKDVVFETTPFEKSLDAAMRGSLEGVTVTEVVEDRSAVEQRYEPNNPEANEEGYVLYPAVNEMEEMSNLVAAARSYEANLSAINIAKAMIVRTLEIGK